MAVWTDIITELKTGVDGMTAAGLYNYDYDNVDERRPASKTYPNVLIEYDEEISRADDESPINTYNVDRVVTFIITIDDAVSPIDTYLDLVLEDFKRLLEFEHGDLNCQGLVVEQYGGETREYTHTRARPAKMTIKFNFNYRVNRTDPSLTS